jgi:hypothetical protein
MADTSNHWFDPVRLRNGGKDRQQPHEQGGDGWEFKNWHRAIGGIGMSAYDVDLIEWRTVNGVFLPVATLEITRVRNLYHESGELIDVPPSYLDHILQRFEEIGNQAKAARATAYALNVYSYIVLYREDCSEFWVFNLTLRVGWRHFDPEQMKEFLQTRENKLNTDW